MIWTFATIHSVVGAQEPAAPPQEASRSAESSRSVWDGVYSEEQAKRGESVYKQECAACHGQTLEGNGEAAGPLTGPVFVAMWNGLTLGDLFERIRLSMPQNNPGKLSRQQNADVIAYLLAANKLPTGKTELARETERLRQIRFDAMKEGK